MTLAKKCIASRPEDESEKASLPSVPLPAPKDGQSLRHRVLRAGSWTLLSHMATQMVRLGGNLLLTRLLVPEAFGLMAVVYVMMTGLALFSDIGLKQSVIQNARGADPRFLNTAWAVQIGRGFLIWVVASLFAFLLPGLQEATWIPSSSVYANKSLPAIIVVFSFLAVLQGFESTKLAQADRELQLQQVTMLELSAQLVGLIVMLGWAHASPSVWALVAGAHASGWARCLGSHFLLKGQANRVQWDDSAFREIFKLGKWIFLSSILGFLAMNGDRLLLGGLISVAEMGIYSIAFLLINSFQLLVGSMLAKVAFPAISEAVRNSPANATQVLRKFQLFVDLVLFGVAGFLFMAGPALVQFLYDARYQSAGGVLAWLAIGLIGMRGRVVEQYCLACGETAQLTYGNVLRMLVLYIGLPMGFNFAGVQGALFAVVASQFAAWPILYAFQIKRKIFSWQNEFLGLPAWAGGMLAGWAAVLLLSKF